MRHDNKKALSESQGSFGKLMKLKLHLRKQINYSIGFPECKTNFNKYFKIDKLTVKLENKVRSFENCFTLATQELYTWQSIIARLISGTVIFLMGWKMWKYPIPHAVSVAVFELPAHPNFRVDLKPSKGNYTMNPSILQHSLSVLNAEYEHYSTLHSENPYMGYADRANAIYNAIDALKQAYPIYPTLNPKNRLERITGAFKGGVA